MADINLGILKRDNHRKGRLRKKYVVTIEDSPYSFEPNSFDCSFGFGKMGSRDFKDLEARYIHHRIEGLYAIVIPAGGGKSTVAKRFSQLDVDKILPAHIEDSLRRLRKETFDSIVSGGNTRMSWLRHNSLWCRHLLMALSGYDFSAAPRVLFIHSYEIALVVGAKVIGVLLPTTELHEVWTLGREPAALALSKENREMINRYVRGVPNMFEYATEHELNKMVSEIIGDELGYCPGIGQHLSMSEIDSLMKQEGYDTTIPQRIKREQYQYEDLDSIVEWCKHGQCPWWHVTTWCQQYSPELLADGAYSLEAYPWLHLGYEMQVLSMNRNLPRTIVHAMVKSNLDWFGVFPYTDSLTKSRGGVCLRPLLKHLPDEEVDDYLVVILNAHVGSHHSFVVSVVCYYLGVIKKLRSELRDLVMDSDMLLVPEEQWVEIHTEIHKWVRASQTFFGMVLDDKEYALLQYTASLYGRRNYRLDPQSEIEKRQKPRLITKSSGYLEGNNRESYINDFKAGVRLAYVRLGCKGKLRWRNFNQFFQTRYQWAAGGSVTNVPDGMEHLKSISEIVVETKEQLMRLSLDSNKKRAMEKLESPSELAMYLSQHWAYNVTSLAPKPNEPAKERVLMPGSFLHYVAMSYILGMVERTGDVGAVRVGDPEDNNLSHFDLRMMGGAYNFMLDFADHNAQHSNLEMSIIISLLEEKFLSKSDPSDLNYFIDWVVDSFSNMKVRIGPNNHEVISGLFTGWRGTTWINSVACQAYVHVGVEACKRKFGAVECSYFEGAGDDVYMRFASAKDAFRFYDSMKKCGFDMQSIKQMASHRRTEFLRTISTEGHLACCINRVLPNFVSGDLERAGEGVLDKLGGCYATIKMLVRRGLRPCISKAMYNAFLDKWARVRKDDEYVDVDRKYIHAPHTQGGLGLPDANDCLWYLNNKIVIPKKTKKIIICDDKASRDYSAMMRQELSERNLHLDERVFRERLLMDVYNVKEDLDISDISNLNNKVIAFVPPRSAVDHNLLAEVVGHVDDGKVREYKRQWGVYGKYKQAISCLDEPEDVALKSLGINMDVRSLEKLKFPTNHCFLIPEYLLYNIGLFFRSRVAFKEMSVDEAEYYFTVASSTAAETYGEELML